MHLTTEKVTLRVFWAAMLTCAGTVLFAVWLTVDGEPSALQGKIAFTAFVIGFASFLIWAPLMVHRFYENIAGDG